MTKIEDSQPPLQRGEIEELLYSVATDVLIRYDDFILWMEEFLAKSPVPIKNPKIIEMLCHDAHCFINERCVEKAMAELKGEDKEWDV